MSYFPDASIGATGAAPPTVATFVGGTDGTDLRGLAVDSSGKQRVLLYDAAGNALTSTGGALNVNLGSGLANPLPTTDAADGATGAAVPSKAIQAAGSDGTNLRAVATDTSGRQKVLLFDSAGTAIVLVSGRVPVDGSGVTQPISAASLPLPTGASTAAKQPAFGTAGTPSADVISVQGVAGGTPQPENLTQLAGTAIDVNSGNKSTGTQRVVLATDQPLLTNWTEQATYSGSVLHPKMEANLVFGSNISTFTSLAVVTGAPGYYVKGYRVNYNGAIFSSTTSAVLTLTDSVSGIFAVVILTIGTTVQSLVYPIDNNPGFFWNNKSANSSLTITLNTNLTGGTFFVNVYYGLCSFIG